MGDSTDKSASSTQDNYIHSIKGEASYWNSLSRRRVCVYVSVCVWDCVCAGVNVHVCLCMCEGPRAS